MSLRAKIFQCDVLDMLPRLPDGCFDSVITDPPYGLEFMGKEWDSFRTGDGFRRSRNQADAGRGSVFGRMSRTSPEYVAGLNFQGWCEQWAGECLRLLKPGGYLISFGGTRTYHRLVCAIEDAGFEIRDSLHWIYGSGFPKGKACLKPAHEPIVLARKPDKRVAPFSGLEACKVGSEVRVNPAAGNKPGGASLNMSVVGMPQDAEGRIAEGRWPPNLLLTHSADCVPSGTKRVRSSKPAVFHRAAENEGNTSAAYGAESRHEGHVTPGYGDAAGMETVQAWECAPGCPVAELDAQSGISKDGIAVQRNRSGQKPASVYGKFGTTTDDQGYGGQGGASRFFPQFTWDPDYDLPFLYCPKAPKKERPQVEGLPGHPTVKPLALMRWLARLVTPPGGAVLEPFAGTGTTVQACLNEGFRCVAVERDPDSIRRIRVRLSDYAGVGYRVMEPSATEEAAG